MVKFLECNIREITRRGSWARGFFHHWAFMQVYLVFGCLLNKMCISHIRIGHCICAIPQYDHSVCVIFFSVAFPVFLLSSPFRPFTSYYALNGRYGGEKYGNHSMKSCLCIFLITFFRRTHKRHTNKMYRNVDFSIESNCKRSERARAICLHATAIITPSMAVAGWFRLKWPCNQQLSRRTDFIFQLFFGEKFSIIFEQSAFYLWLVMTCHSPPARKVTYSFQPAGDEIYAFLMNYTQISTT